MKTKNFKAATTVVSSFVLFIIAMGFALFITSCQSTEPSSAASEAISTTAGDVAQVSANSDAVVNAANQFVPNFSSSAAKVQSEASSKGLRDSIHISVDKPDAVTYPKVVVIDYGTTGIVGKRGNILKGKMTVTISGKMNLVGSTKTITLENFSVNGNAISGTKVITNIGNESWTINATDTITRADGSVVTCITQRTRTRIENHSTSVSKEDESFAITGTSTGVNAKGVAFTMTIDATNPLIINDECPFFVKGKATITTENRTLFLDYGNGTNDAIATATGIRSERGGNLFSKQVDK
jgi:hypothetical protein